MGIGKIFKIVAEEIVATGTPPTLAARGSTSSRGRVVRATQIPDGECPGGCGSRGRHVKHTGWCGRRGCKTDAARALGGM